MSWIGTSTEQTFRSSFVGSGAAAKAPSQTAKAPRITKKEVILQPARQEVQLPSSRWDKEARKLVRELTEFPDSPESIFKKATTLIRGVAEEVASETISKNLPIRGSTDIFGYRPASARIWNYFPNPFGVYSYLAEDFGAARMSLDVIRREVWNDSFQPKVLEGATKDEIRRYRNFTKENDLSFLRTEMAIHLKTFGNCLLLPHFNPFDGLLSLELLYPDRLYPIYNPELSKIVQWEYTIGDRASVIYNASDLIHLKIPSVRSSEIGTPPLSPLVTMMESDMYGDILNNLVRQRGGLLKAIVGLEAPRVNGQVVDDDEEYMERVQTRFDTLFSGTRSGQTVAVMENVKGVYPLTDVGALENNFRLSKDQIYKYVAFCLGVPSEKIGIQRAPSVQYVPGFTQNQLNLDFDKEINYLMMMVDSCLNAVFAKYLRIVNISLQASGRYGAATLAGAQTILALGQAGFKPTHNECRTRVLGWDELPDSDPRANQVVDISVNRDTEASPQETAPPPPDPMLNPDLDDSDIPDELEGEEEEED